MCKPVKDWLGVLREYTKEVITFGGFIMCVFVYLDFRDMTLQMAALSAQTNEILRSMDGRITSLENWHALEERESRKPKVDN